jgi:hypothetical protein
MSERKALIDVSGTGAAAAQRGYANTGVHIGDVNLRTGAPVRTRYRHQVQRIAPTSLPGRDPEIAAMAEFATGAGGYWCWEAGPWSGKSALMSWFALHPPESVRVVSFFVTARLAAQNNRHAFVANVLEQLLALLGEDLPPLLNDATQDAHLLGLLDDAAAACAERGETLVLMVDGLDEDRGVTVGAEAHSIAALLPERPPTSLKVIVSRRPNPPIPTDVGPHHPLRDPATVRVLEPSQAALIVRGDMERELDSLLYGSSEEREILATLVAAGGGLTAGDLSSLTGLPEFRVERQLSVVSGRSFSRRDSHLSNTAAPDVFLLAHEELQETASRTLGPDLAPYRRRLDEWARGHADAGWPEPVPEYLLSGYHHLLLADGDILAAAGLVTDQNRYHQMLDRTGSDSEALTQINSVLRAAAVDGRNLPTVAKLAVHRDHLLDRNSTMTLKLPLTWAKIGNFSRAERLARSMAQPETACFVLAVLSGKLHQQGHVDRAETLLREASATSAAFPDQQRRNWTRSAVVSTLATTGRFDEAEALALSDESGSGSRGRVLRSVLKEAARASDIARCERLLPLITAPFQRFMALIAMAGASDTHTSAYLDEALATYGSLAADEPRVRAGRFLVTALIRVGRRDLAMTLFDEMEGDARLLRKASTRAEAMVSVAHAAIELGRPEHAEKLIDEATGLLLKSGADAETRLRLVAAITYAQVELGGLGRARAFADSLDDPFLRSESLVALAGSAASTGEEALARGLLQTAEVTSRFAFGPDRVDRAKATLALIAATRGNLLQATLTAGSIISVSGRGRAFAAVAYAGGAHIKHWPTDFLADPALGIPNFRRVGHELVRGVAAAGATDVAVAMATEFFIEPHRRKAMLAIVGELAARGDFDEATAVAQTIRNNDGAIASVVEAAVAHSRMALVEEFAGTVRARGPWNRVQRALAEAAARAGDQDRALAIINSVSSRALQDQVRGAVVAGLAATGQITEAKRVGATVEGPATRNRIMAALAVAEAEAGNLERSAAYAGQVASLDLITEYFTGAAMSRGGGAGQDLLARALLHGSWLGCVAALDRLDPVALDVAQSELLRTTSTADLTTSPQPEEAG